MEYEESTTMAENWYQGRSDLYKIDPREIVIVEGWNPRCEMDLDSLIPSIRENGVKIPLRVSRNKEGQIELRDGERRYRAVMELIKQGCDILTVPCVLEIDPVTKKRPTEADMLLSAMIANTGKPFTAVEEANGMRRFLAWGWSVELLATRMGKSLGTVRNSLALLDAAPEIIAALQEGMITKTEAVAVVRQARQTEEPQEEVLAERQMAKREKKASTRKREDPRKAFTNKIMILCASESPEDVVDAVIWYLRTVNGEARYIGALLEAQLHGDRDPQCHAPGA
jgi:ParB family chromosome partitioning protein